MGVLGLPVAPRHPQRVLDGAVGLVARGGLQFRDQHESFPVVTAVGVQTVLEGGPDVLLVVGAAVLDELLQLGSVLLNVWVGRHEWIISRHRPGGGKIIQRRSWGAHEEFGLELPRPGDAVQVSTEVRYPERPGGVPPRPGSWCIIGIWNTQCMPWNQTSRTPHRFIVPIGHHDQPSFCQWVGQTGKTHSPDGQGGQYCRFPAWSGPLLGSAATFQGP